MHTKGLLNECGMLMFAVQANIMFEKELESYELLGMGLYFVHKPCNKICGL